MKNRLLTTALTLLTLLFSINNVSAVTAINSGNWSSATTWDGPVPGSNVNNENITIPAGITVTLDMNVVYSGIINTFRVDGRLASTQNYGITINQGTLAGSGDIDIYSVTFSSIAAGSTYTGEMDVNEFTNAGATLFLSSILNVMDTMDLRDGGIFLNSGAALQMMNNSTLRMDDGSMQIGTGGVFTTQSYNILYVGGSKTSGIELNGSMVKNMTIDLDDNSQSLTVGSNLIISGDLDFRRGTFDIRNRTLDLRGNLTRAQSATLMANESTNLVVQGGGEMTDGFLFAAGSSVNDITIDRSSNSSHFRILSDLTATGDVTLTDGNLNIENGAHLIMGAGSRLIIEEGTLVEVGGTFEASNEYDVEYTGTSRTTGRELSGSGLRNVGINLISSDQNLTLTQSIVSQGNWRMDNGRIILNGNDLTLNGTMNQKESARIVGNAASSLVLNVTSTPDDTLYFDNSANTIKNFTLNKMNGGDVYLGSGMTVLNQLNLQAGRLGLGAQNLIMQSSSTMIGYDRDRYIMTTGQGSLQQMITANSAYKIFPVGSVSSYSPASVQQASGSSSGMFMVRAADGVYANASNSTGVNYASTQKILDRTWFVESAAGMTINTNLRLGWDDSFEMNGFNRNSAFVSHYTGGQWDRATGGSATAGANNTFYIERNGFTSLSPFTVMDLLSSVGIQEVAQNGELSIYPNPSADFINVSSPYAGERVQYEIIDLTGKVVYTTTNTETVNKIDVGSFPKGYYMVKSTNLKTNSTITKKLIKS